MRIPIYVYVLSGCVLGGTVVGLVVHTNAQKLQRELRRNLDDDGRRILGEQEGRHKQAQNALRRALRAQGLKEPEVKAIVDKVGVQFAVAPARSPHGIINELIGLRDRNGRGRTEMNRLLIRNVEYLVDHGNAALPAISEYLERQEEIDYGHDISGDSRRGRLNMDFLLPPTLRFALFNAVRRIGTDQAVQVLASELQVTGRAVELTYLTGALEEMAPEQYKDHVLAAAHELLTMPPDLEDGGKSRLDKNQRVYLFAILRKYKDETFVAEAEKQLIVKTKNEKGQTRVSVDGTVMAYINDVLDERAMPILARIYDNPEVPDNAKSDIRRTAVSNLGRSTDAENIIRSRFEEGFFLLTRKDDRKSRGRGNELIDYYLTALTSSRNTDESIIASRRNFLSSLRGRTEDSSVQAKMEKVDRRLQDMMDPEKAKKLPRFSLSERKK